MEVKILVTPISLNWLMIMRKYLKIKQNSSMYLSLLSHTLMLVVKYLIEVRLKGEIKKKRGRKPNAQSALVRDESPANKRRKIVQINKKVSKKEKLKLLAKK
jgi:hypothetical protein